MADDAPDDAHYDAAALREFVGDTLCLALHGKKKERLLAIRTLGAITLALTFPARCDIKVYVGDTMVENAASAEPSPRCDRCFGPMPCDKHCDEIKPEPLRPSDPVPSEAPAGFYAREDKLATLRESPYAPRDTSDHPSCVINEDAHGH